MRCPACRAQNDTGPACRRCRADLSLLFALEEERLRALDAARRHLAGGDADEALAHAERADALRRGEDSRQLLAVVHLLRRDFGRAWQIFREAPREAAG